MPEHFKVNTLRGPVGPYAFGRMVGDDDMVALYKRSNRLRKTIDITGWVGGGVCIYGGLVGVMMGGFGDSPELMLMGAGLGGTGVLAITLASVNHGMWGNRLDDYGTFWTYDEAVALVDEYNAALGENYRPPSDEVDILDVGTSFAAYGRDGRLTPGEFARQVGDNETYRLWNTARLTFNITGWAGFGIGVYLSALFMPEALMDMGNGRLPDAGAGLAALTGATLLIGGPVVVYGTKLVYNDLSRYYSRDDAQRWADSAGPQTRQGPEVELYPTAVVVRW